MTRTSYIYCYGVAVNPTSIHIDLKMSSIKSTRKFVDLPTFEMPDGSRPFKNFDFKDKDGTRVMGSIWEIKRDNVDAKL